MSWDSVQTHLLLEEKYRLIHPGLGTGKNKKEKHPYVPCCFINGDNYGNGATMSQRVIAAN